MLVLNTVCRSEVNVPNMPGVYSTFMDLLATPIERLLGEARKRKWKDADLCRRLEVSAQRLNNWKERGIPAQAAMEAAQRLNLSLDYLLLGRGPREAEPARIREELALYTTTPDRQKVLLDLFDQLTPPQQDKVIDELRAHVDANLAVVKHFQGRKLRPALDERIEATFGLPSSTTKGN